MTEIEKKKEYLNSYRNMLKELKSIEMQDKELRSELESAKAIKYDDMPKAHKKVDLSDSMVLLEKIKENYEKSKEKAEVIKYEIWLTIAVMKDPNERDVLFLKYIKNEEWTEIAKFIGYGVKQTQRIHGNALVNYKTNINKDVSQCLSKSL